MSQKEFLEELRTALSGKLSAQAVLENIEYYRNYIEGEVRSGKSEAQVLEMLGDPWILARTISDAQDGTDDSIVNEAGGSDYGAYGEEVSPSLYATPAAAHAPVPFAMVYPAPLS